MLISMLRKYHKIGLKGSNRVTIFLAKHFKSLQNVALSTANGQVYADLRIISAHTLLKENDLVVEEQVMKRLVRAGDVVYDIGANLGLFTLALSNLVGETGKVYAFEPNPEILRNLQLTLKQKSNIELFPIALSDYEGEAMLFIPEDVSMASLGNWTEPIKAISGKVHKTSCEVRRLNDLISSKALPLPQFIKCDIEGAELSMLKGGTQIFNRIDAPIFMFEVNAMASHALMNDQIISDFLNTLSLPKYSYFEISENDCLKEIQSSDFQWNNIVAVPSSKLDRLN